MSEPSIQSKPSADDTGARRSSIGWIKFIFFLIALWVLWLFLDDLIIGTFKWIVGAVGWTGGAIGSTVGFFVENAAFIPVILVVGAAAVGIIKMVASNNDNVLNGTCRSCGAPGTGYRICNRCGRKKG